MHAYKKHLKKMVLPLAASFVVLLVAAPVMAKTAKTTKTTTSTFEPTMADWLSVNDAINNYRLSVEKGDKEAGAKAFWPDGKNIAVPSPGQEFQMSLVGEAPLAGGGPGGAGGPPGGFPGGGAGGPPGGGAGAGGPPGGGAGGPPGGGAGGPPGGGGGAGGPPGGGGGAGGPPGGGGGAGGPPGGGGGVWHMPFASYFHFDSPTRATHYEYFLSIYPQAEGKAGSGGTQGAGMSSTRTSIVGWPGHYEDILEKRNGEWRILQRKSMINQK
jgi:hypothetical protein